MRLLFIILTVFCNIYIAYAQTITGQVMDEGQNPVGYANVGTTVRDGVLKPA